MAWQVAFADEFYADYRRLADAVQDELLLGVRLLEVYGPKLGRPHVDTLNGSNFANMKELRFRAADGVWRVAFAFDPKRRAILFGRRRQERDERGALLQAPDCKCGRAL